MVLWSIVWAQPPAALEPSSFYRPDAVERGPYAAPLHPRWDVRPLVRPILEGSVLSASRRISTQVRGGLALGAEFTRSGYHSDGQRRSPFVITTRLRSDFQLGLNTFSWGYDTRFGTFIGPKGRWGRLEVGPDVWLGQYGPVLARDYHLPFGAGVSLRTQVTLAIQPDEVCLKLGVAPSYTPFRSRQAHPLLHEWHGWVVVESKSWPVNFAVGYRVDYTVAGAVHGVFLTSPNPLAWLW